MTQTSAKKSIFLKVLRGEPTERPPVWFMRQAGRCLPAYRKLKERYSFKTLMETPELAAKVTLLPIDALGVDAAIIFSDILVIAEALGFEVSFSSLGKKGGGPRISPALQSSSLSPDDHPYNPDAPALHALARAISSVKKERPDIPLIGFCGGPLTVFLYLFTGKGGSFTDALHFIDKEPILFQQWMQVLTDASILYGQMQIASGIDAFQIFESWAGILPHERYHNEILPHSCRLAHALERDIPVIFFPREFNPAYDGFPTKSFTGLSLAHNISLASVANILTKLNRGSEKKTPFILQGNIPPEHLIKLNATELRHYLQEYLHFFKLYPHWIVNLGHGVLPQTPENSLKLIVTTIKESFPNTPPT